MNARKFLNVRVSLTVTALAVSAAFVISASCAGGGGGGTGGSGGGGGSTATGCGDAPADTISFCQGSAKGLMTGAAWVALGSSDTLTDPTCGSDKITHDKPCNSATTWSKDDQVCMTGTIPALSANPLQAEYDANFGVQIGVNASEPNTTLFDASAYTYVTFNVTGTPAKGLRAMIHRKGDDDATVYCATFKEEDPKLTITAFNTKCWGDSTTVAFTDADKKNIDKIGVQVSSTQTAITVDNLCLTSVVFGK